jgi:two-component system, NarL family, sensor histidine kinase BarA
LNNLIRRFASRINNKLILLSVLPVTLVTLVITLYTIDSRRTEIQHFHASNAERLAKNLATIADFALYSGNQTILQTFSKAGKEVPSIAGVYFLDSKRNSLLPLPQDSPLTQKKLTTREYQSLPPEFMVIEEPAYLNRLKVDDYSDAPLDDNSVLLGWVVVVADDSEARKKSREILFTHLLISFMVLFGSILLSLMLSNSVVAPVKAMIRAVRELERGNYDARIKSTTADELAILANGINHLAKAVSESRKDLEGKVEMATYQLKEALTDLTRKNGELEDARKTAEAASTAKGDFLAQMSHELRTPITAIQGFVKLLEASDLTPAEQRYCLIIQQASEQLLQLIDDILDITRLQTNSIYIESLPFNLVDCVEAPLALMAASAHNKQLELIFDLAPNVPLALIGDSLRLRQIIYNLVSNAIKFTPGGYVMVKIRASAPKDNRITLLFQVMDTGIGIPDRHQARLFEPFSQADSSISRRFGGSGLGLSIVKQLVNLMHGTISLESTTGKGSSFVIRLPMTLQPQSEELLKPERHKVMLFDSHPQNRQALENHLGRFVEIIDSCENFSDLEISENDEPPEMIIYSPEVTQQIADIATDIQRLRSHLSCPIAVLTPASTQFKNLPELLTSKYQDLRFYSKPPGNREMAELLSPEKYGVKSDHTKQSMQANILVAEDNDFTRLLLDTFFTSRGCQITLARDGEEAISACRTTVFDLILMDVHMPEINGIRALETIRTGNGPNSQTPIIMLTADILQQEENALFELGASDLVFKPFDEHRLLAAVQKHLRQDIASQGDDSVDSGEDVQKQMFVDEILRLTNEANANLAAGDGDALRETIHQLLGIAGVYHMAYLERAVQALHLAVKVGNGNKIVAAMETMILEVEKLREEPTSR